MRSSFRPLVALSSVAVSASRTMTSSPTAIDRSGLTVTYTGWSGRGCGSTALAGRSTPRSTVASGAATMKMISSTSITSMNGVTLISWASARSSSLPRARIPNRAPMTALLRGACGAGRATAAIETALKTSLAADQQQQLRRGVAEQRAIRRDRTRQIIIDHDRRDGRDQPERGRQQRLGNSRRDHREVGGVGLGDADKGIHDAPHRAEQSDEGRGGADGREHAGAARHPPRHRSLDPLQPQRDALLEAVLDNAARKRCLPRGGLNDLRDRVAAILAVMRDIGQRGVALEQVE